MQFCYNATIPFVQSNNICYSLAVAQYSRDFRSSTSACLIHYFILLHMSLIKHIHENPKCNPVTNFSDDANVESRKYGIPILKLGIFHDLSMIFPILRSLDTNKTSNLEIFVFVIFCIFAVNHLSFKIGSIMFSTNPVRPE